LLYSHLCHPEPSAAAGRVEGPIEEYVADCVIAVAADRSPGVHLPDYPATTMSFLQEVQLDPAFPPFGAFREHFGLVPNLFRAQTLMPRVIEVEAHVANAVVLTERGLARIQKETILLAVAADKRNDYCVTIHGEFLRSLGMPERQLEQLLRDHRAAGLSPREVALLDFSIRLGRRAYTVSSHDIEALRAHGFSDGAILEAILVTALARFLCTLSDGLRPEPDFPVRGIPASPAQSTAGRAFEHSHGSTTSGPYLATVERRPESFAPFAFLEKSFGFIPNIFRAQGLRPDVLEAEAHAIETVLLTEDVLTRVQKECILLVISAANFNSYCVAVHCEMLRNIGVLPEEADRIVVDHHLSNLSVADQALLDFALKLGVRPAEFGREDIEKLRAHGFTEKQVLEGVVMAALTNFLNTLQSGLGTVPDFEPRTSFDEAKIALFAAEKYDGTAEGHDAQLVERVQTGDVEAFAELAGAHMHRAYHTALAVLGEVPKAQEVAEDSLLAAFERLGEIGPDSKVSTWLTGVAYQAAVERLRDPTILATLQDDAGQEADFRPREMRAWPKDAERLFSPVEVQSLVEMAVMALPPRYRIVVMLRDLEHMPISEMARALRLDARTLRARLARGRLLLQESLTPHFAAKAGRQSA
jgi:RNA polymerase sigma-70 factor, ECF subfamily